MLFIEELNEKQFYTIKDICKVTNKKSDTIRSWERKGIIHKPKETMYSVGFCYAGWRKYSKKEFIEVLEDIVNHNWERNVIKNKTEIEMYIEYLK